MDERWTGTVLRTDQGVRTVRLDASEEDGEPVELRCTVRGSLKKALRETGRDKVVVGDRVRLVRTGSGEGVIEEVLPRRSALVRRLAAEAAGVRVTAANVDRIAVVVACREPEWKPGFVDRVLCAAERCEVDQLLVMNKVDLLGAAEREALRARLRAYQEIGVSVLETSVQTGEGIAALGDRLAGAVSVVTGPSGVGKTSLLNAIEPDLGARVGAVSRATRKGRHTTTAVTMIPLSRGGYLIDTPGVRSFGFHDLSPRELGWLFRDLRPYAYYDGDPEAPRCRFQDCRHVREPGCAVRAAVEAGRVSPERYRSYLRILSSLTGEEAPR